MVTAKRTIPRSPPARTTVLAVGLALAATVLAAGPVAPASAAGATAAAAATAQAGSGSSRMSLEGKGLRGLRKLGVKLSATKPVRISRTALVFPVSTGALASSLRLDSKGTLVLRKGKRRLKLTAPQVKMAKKGAITAKLGTRRITLFSVTPAKGKAMRINTATGRATLQSARVTMPKSTGRRIRKALRLRGTPHGSFGTVTVIATIRRGADGGGTLPGAGGPGTPVGKPLAASEPPVLARPASAVDVAVHSLTWELRESFVNYMNTEQAPAVSAGATTSGAPENRGTGKSLHYRYGYAPVSGWWDPVSKTAALYYAGTIHFRFPSHGIDFETKDPEIEINGGASRAIFRLDGRGGTTYGNKRGVLLDMEPTTTTAGGRCVTAGQTVTCNEIPGKVPADAGSSVFAGFYQAGDTFGDLSVSFTTP